MDTGVSEKVRRAQIKERIADLKKSAAEHYTAYRRMLSTFDADCGRGLFEYLHPEAELHRRAFNSLMDALARLDPNCPEGRL